jgi:hypothetical protein
MKRLYIICGMAVLALGVNAQGIDKSSLKQLPSQLSLNKKASSTVTDQQKAPGDIIWTEDFTTGIPAGWSTVDNNGMGYDWVINNADITADFTSTTAIASTSGGNHMLLFGDENNVGGGSTPMDAYFQTAAISMGTGYPAVSIRFEQKFRECCTGAASMNVIVSRDAAFTPGATTVAYNTNSASVAVNATSADPLMTSINISAVAGGGYAGDIYIRFHKTINSHYFWMVDDIELFETESFDISLNADSWYHNPLYKIQYSLIPLDQVAGISFDGTIQNLGGSAMPNTSLSANVSGAGTGTVNSTPINLAPVTTIVAETAPFTPSALGVYNTLITVAGDSAETDLSNNNSTGIFEVTNFVYGKDSDVMTGSFGPFDDDGDGIDDPYEVYAEYELNAATDFTGMLLCVSGATSVGAEIYYNFYHEDVASGTIVPEYDGLLVPVPMYTITAADITSATTTNWITLPYPTVISVDPAISQAVYPVAGYNIDPVNFAVSGTAADTSNYLTVFGTTAGETGYFITSTPMMRLSQDLNIGIDEADLGGIALGQNMPNPFNANTIVPFSLINAATVEFTVTDLMGKIVERQELGTLSSGDHTIDFEAGNLAGGIYYYTVSANGKSTTKKMSVAK